MLYSIIRGDKMNPCNSTDKLIRNYVRDSAQYIECWEFETAEGGYYTICQDQNGEEWIIEGE
jgi:hypothetical protein